MDEVRSKKSGTVVGDTKILNAVVELVASNVCRFEKPDKMLAKPQTKVWVDGVSAIQVRADSSLQDLPSIENIKA